MSPVDGVLFGPRIITPPPPSLLYYHRAAPTFLLIVLLLAVIVTNARAFTSLRAVSVPLGRRGAASTFGRRRLSSTVTVGNVMAHNATHGDVVVEADDGPVSAFVDEEDHRENQHNSDDECQIDVPDGYCQCFDDAGCSALERMDGSHSVRIEAGPNPCLEEIHTAEDLWRRIEEARVEQRIKCGGSVEDSLYKRRWLPADSGAESGSKDGAEPSSWSFTAMQFNVLAEGLSSAPRAILPPPFASSGARDDEEQGNKSDGSGGYGGFTAVPHPDVVLGFNMRRWRLMEVLLGKYCTKNAPAGIAAEAASFSSSDSRLPFDIIALEELDRYHGFFKPLLRLLGYGSAFVPKPRGPGVELGYYSDGCAVFWNRDKFELASSELEGLQGGGVIRRSKFTVGNQVYLVVVLRHKESNRHIVVGCTHLKAKKGQMNEKVRAAQISELLVVLDETRSKIAQENGRKAGDVPILLLGDFNAEPFGECVCAVRNHHRIAPAAGGGGTKLTSAYDLSEEGSYTTWKTRGPNTVRRTIDYIFHSGKKNHGGPCGSAGPGGSAPGGKKERAGGGGELRCTHVLSVPSLDEVEGHGLPGMRQPSDHFALAARFELSRE